MRSSNQRLKVLSWFAAAVVLFGAAFAGRHYTARLIEARTRGAAAAGGATPGDRSQAQAASPASAAHGWEQGDRRDHRLTLAAKVSSSDGSTVYQLTVAGTWQLTAISAAAHGVTLLHGMLVGARVVTDQPGAEPARLAELAKQLESPVLIALDPRGAVREFTIAAGKPATAASLLKSIAAYEQFSAPLGAERSWSADETDATGKYRAEYRADAKAAGSVHKTKAVYLELLGTSDLKLRSSSTVEVKKSDATFELDARGLARKVNVSEKVVTRGSMFPEMASLADFSLELTGTHRLSPEELAALLRVLPSTTAQPLYAAAPMTGSSPDLDRVRVAGRSFDDLMKELDAFPSASDLAVHREEMSVEQREEHDKLFSALSALLRLDDDSVDEAVKQIRAGSQEAPMLRDALWNAGTSHAQAELVKLMSFFKDERDRRFTMIGLGLVKQPTAATVSYLQTMLDDTMHGKQARLSLGTTAQHLDETDPEAAGAVIKVLTDRYQASKDPIVRATYIDALGNTRDDTAMATIMAALQSEESTERSAAVMALRYMHGEKVDDTIKLVAISDSDSIVRNTAISTISDRTPTQPLMEALDTLMRNDPEVMVRRGAVMVGVGLREQVPRLRDTIRWVAGNDPEPQMRELAAAYP